MVHVVNKGKDGEREVCTMLRQEIEELIAKKGYEGATIDTLRSVVQRNQNQSAAGGGDINLFGLSIEVKRQETLSIEAWWKQTTTSASRNNDKPVLIYRQNRKAWNVVTWGWVELPDGTYLQSRVTISLENFLAWFRFWVELQVRRGEIERI